MSVLLWFNLEASTYVSFSKMASRVQKFLYTISFQSAIVHTIATIHCLTHTPSQLKVSSRILLPLKRRYTGKYCGGSALYISK